MSLLDDVLAIEGDAETEEEYFEAIQRTINAGTWGLQGSFGRTMMDAITSGHCLLGKTGCRDYYGNYIPSRDEVKSGTKGSLAFVAAQHDQEYADYMAAL